MLDKKRYAVLTIAILLAFLFQLFYGSSLGGSLYSFAKSLGLIAVLSLFLYNIQLAARDYNFTQHLLKAIKIMFFSLMLTIPLLILTSVRFNGNAMSSIVESAPRIMHDMIINIVLSLPVILIASFICYDLLRRKKKELVVGDHLIDSNNK